MQYILMLHLVWTMQFIGSYVEIKEVAFPSKYACEQAIPLYREFYGEEVVRKASCLPGGLD